MSTFDRAAHCRKIAALGGKTTVSKHGKAHMRALGKKGAARTHALYALKPIGFNDFVMVNRETGEVKARINGGW